MAPRDPALRSLSAVPLSLLLVLALLSGTTLASAGRLDPEVDASLSAVPPGSLVPVIVELADQVDPHAAALPHPSRHAKGRAVVDALRDTAARTQGPIRAWLAREQAAGRADRVVPLWVLNAVALRAAEPVVRALAARPDVRVVRLDRVIPRPAPVPAAALPAAAASEWNVEQVGAPDVWAVDPAYTGVGSVVGSFDTGVDGSHPDLAPRYRGNDATSWFDPYGEHAAPFDADGHGTHTTGTAVGGDASGYAIGIAPGARWIAAKAWDDSGVGVVSTFHQIFQWFLAPGGDPAGMPDVVNMSWAFAESGCLTDFLPDVQAFRAAGIFPSFAAGNSGPFPGSVASPGAYAESFAVGATDVFDDVPYFSGRGPSPCDGGVKPDMGAPGDAITSAVPWGYETFSGTSMAAPHVTGAVAVLRSINPALTVPELEAALRQGAVDLGPAGPDDDSGAGRLDLFQSAQIALGGGGPDQPRVTIAATSPTATEAGPTPGVFTVTRTGGTDAELVVRYGVAGTALRGQDYVTLPGAVTIPTGAVTAPIVVTPIDDTVVELDETVVVSLRPDPAYFVARPGRATVTIVSDEVPPDLAVAALGVPPTAAAGAPVTVTETTKNQGGGPAGPSTTRFYLSVNAVLDAADLPLGSRAIPSLAPGASSAGSTAVTIPAGTAPGTYVVLAVADADQALLETSETNNTAFAYVQIGPDLVVSSLSASASVSAGGTITVTDTTKNQGAGPSAASTTRFYLSTNPVLDGADVPLGGRAIPALAANAVSTGSTLLAVPADVTGGTYYVLAHADGDEAVAETNESNNTASAIVRIGPDLVVSALTLPAAAGAGSDVTITDTTTNRGGGAAAASTTRFYLSADVYWDAGDVPLGARAVPALAAGAASSGSTAVTIPAGTGPGSYYILARADAGGVVVESDETNNVAGRVVDIGGDLVIVAVSAPAAAGAGTAITVTDTTKNQGAGAVGPSTTRFYLSPDGVLDGSDAVLGSRPVPALAGGASSLGSTVVTIPAGTPAGSYYLFALADAAGTVAETVETNNRGVAVLQVGGDLVVSALAVPGTAGAGASITVTDTTKNQGGGGVGASVTRLYLSADPAWDAADPVLGSRAVPALAGGASSSGSTVVTIPAGTAAGPWYVLARADADQAVSETVETNNTASATVLVGPDLVVSALSAPTSAAAGGTVTVSDSTRNQGAGAAGVSTTRIYFSTTTLPRPGDPLVGSRAVPALTAGGASAGSVAVTIPAATPAGRYYLVAVADGDGAVAETIETNNTAVWAIQVGGDLVVSALVVPPTGAAGAPISVTDTTRNQGAGGVDASTTRFFLSADAALDPADIPLGSRMVPALAAGALSTVSTTLTIPSGTPAGTWYVLAQADADATVSETLESNNTMARSLQIGGDLVVTALSAPATAGAGATITVTDTVKNQGGAPAGASTTGFYLSANGVLDGGDAWLGSRAVPPLDAGAASTGSTLLTVPAATAPGTWYLLARADNDGAVSEIQEGNNTSYAVVQVGPDLTVLAPSVPAAAGAGDSITVTDTTRNAGGGAAAPSTTGFYLSTNPGLDAGDVWLGSRAVPALAAGGASTGSTAVTIPPGTAPGMYYVIAVADTEGAVAESQEGNNSAFTAIRVGADLVIAWITGPGVGGAGGTVTVTDATRNAGAGAVPGTTTAFYLSTNTTLDGGDLLLGSRVVPPLGAGATSTASTVLAIPASVAPGGYYVLARADADGAVTESQEGNNTNYTGLVIGPDLAVLAPTAPATAAAGALITVTDTTRNAGGGSAPASTTAFYLSTNATLDGADLRLGGRPVPELAAGASSTASTSLTIPAGLAAGTWYLFARTDDDGVVAESQEGNNTSYTTLQVTP